jgi:hypothetical protein
MPVALSYWADDGTADFSFTCPHPTSLKQARVRLPCVRRAEAEDPEWAEGLITDKTHAL